MNLARNTETVFVVRIYSVRTAVRTFVTISKIPDVYQNVIHKWDRLCGSERNSLDYAGLAQLCARSPIMRKIMRAHNRIIQRSLVQPIASVTADQAFMFDHTQWRLPEWHHKTHKKRRDSKHKRLIFVQVIVQSKDNIFLKLTASCWFISFALSRDISISSAPKRQ